MRRLLRGRRWAGPDNDVVVVPRAATPLVWLIVVAGLIGSSYAQAEEIFVGTGSRAGVYYHIGRAICGVLDMQASRHDLECAAPPSAGSISNLERIQAGDLDFGVVQSDWQHFAYSGTGRFATQGPFAKLRSLFSVHGEPFTLVARRDAGIATLDDLPGKRVNIGNPGSGQRATMELVMAAKGWDRSTFALANELPASQQSLALCHDRVQAMVYVVGHPNHSVLQATEKCQAELVNVADATIDKLVSDYPFYSYVEIPGGLYRANPQTVTTFGVRATVVTSADTSADVVYELVKAVFENLDAFRKYHAAFTNLAAQKMVSEGLSAPLHEGAVRYFKEKGLL